MTQTRPLSILLMTLIIGIIGSTMARAGDSKQCPAEAKECSRQIREMLEGQKYLGVELINSKRGIAVKAVMPESPAEYARLRSGDIVMVLEGHDISTLQVREIKQYIEDAKKRGRVMMITRRNGIITRIDVRFAVMQKAQIDKIVAAHMKESHSPQDQH